MNADREKLKAVWRQKVIPVLYRQGKGMPLLIKLVSNENADSWLQGEKRRYPRWNYKFNCWEVPQSWLNELVERVLREYGKLFLIQPYKKQEVCAPACWYAVGYKCECSCMGANHGAEADENEWFVVSEYFAAKWGARELACRLMIAE